ncbi:MAG: 16S rRNA (cytidine(1402)-2'-O)-methyltransferase [Rhizobiaceae bacterium]
MTGFTIGTTAFPRRELEPGLYLVSTPIGNLGDITLRALETLGSVDLIACEDTRVTRKLLARYGIDTKVVAYHEHNSGRMGPRLVQRLQAGERLALVSDAGTPLISDPGYRLVESVRQAGLPVWPVPGPSSPIAALSASGLPAETFLFAGFLPSRSTARRKRIEELLPVPATLIFFESPGRLSDTLGELAQIASARDIAVCRELTKLHEEIRRGRAQELQQHYVGEPPKGEIVLLIAPAGPEKEAPDPDELLRELLLNMPVSRAATEAAALTGLAKRDLYQRALRLAGKGQGDK